MNEMEQEKKASLHADVMLRRALDLKAKDNKLIAEFMGMDSFKDSLASLHQGKINVNVDVSEQAQYRTSWDWLMPVIDKCYQEHMSKHIADAVMTCDKDKAYQAVVEFINQLNN